MSLTTYNPANPPLYIKAKSEGRLKEVIERLQLLASPCRLCPRRCMAKRLEGKVGYCNAPYELYLSSAFSHFGEEPPLVGRNGSGTIFFTHCNLKCCFCQNYEISIYGDGTRYTAEGLAEVMLGLQDKGCHNINIVTPTHYVHQLIEGLSIAIDNGLYIPIVYNCGGYESIEVIRLLDGIIDIYMPDIKFFSAGLSERFCNAKDYPEVVKAVVKEMQRQVGDLEMTEDGIVRKGLLIRHLIMPGCYEDTCRILDFIRDEISKAAYVNLMTQYHPCYRAIEHKELTKMITPQEYLRVLSYAKEIGLIRASNY